MNDISFGLRVEQIMVINGINTSTISDATEIPPQQFYDWKKKGTIPNALTAYKVAQYLGTTVEYLLTGKNDNPLQETVNKLQERLKQINDIVAEF